MTPDERAEAIVPTAAALVCAVADLDRDDIAQLLADDVDWRALCVVLAASVDPLSRLARIAKVPMTPEQTVDHIVAAAAATFDVTPELILGTDRRRNVLDARAVTMAACRLVGLSSGFIGRCLNKDHSTVLYAAGKVGEDARLRRITNRIVTPLGVQLVGDEERVA
jgi:hypothetical protein